MILKNLPARTLIEISTSTENSKTTNSGALSTFTGNCTGRSPNAKYIVLDKLTKDTVDWTTNNDISEGEFLEYYKKFLRKKQGVCELIV